MAPTGLLCQHFKLPVSIGWAIAGREEIIEYPQYLSMKRLWLLLLLFAGWTTTLRAQQTYQIRADSVRIYSACDTAELIIENHTQRVPGFLFNKGNGRTEFRKLQLKTLGANLLSIIGQDTVDLSPWGDTRYDLANTNYWKIPDRVTAPFEQWPMHKVIGYDQYAGVDMPYLSNQAFQSIGANTYYNGLVVRTGSTGFDMAVNWDGELMGPNGVFFRVKDDTKPHWSNWREVLFKDYADTFFIRNQKTAPQVAHLWINGAAKIGDSIVLAKYKNNAAGDSVLTTDAAGNLKLKLAGSGSDIYTADGALTADRTVNTGVRSLLFKGVNGTTDSSYLFFRSNVVKLGSLNDPTAGGGISELGTDKYSGVGMRWLREDTIAYTLANKYGVGTYFVKGMYAFINNVTANAVYLGFSKVRDDTNGPAINLSLVLDSSRIAYVTSNSSTRVTYDTLFYVTKYGDAKINGTLEVTGLYQSSQRKLKKDIEPFNRSALDIINKASVQTFKYKADKNGVTHIGFIAEDAPEEMVAPQRIGVDQANTMALLVKAVQEMNQKVESLQQEVTTLKKELADLKKGK
ncbi:tail fiber domain-containing protein [Chitinophaga sp. G-6-1-13]|uniref:Tail fiber domain-containing protein n=1 Tax=Chitinophaga fulva TaxID=2728842 RepID=A0A848GJH8_9BACT|nr:tail fiber domain-containing protein [Chitinophaga fulva]NML38416.1 tail fiber domain-containing protein [Chitinophaga fulva]